MGVRRAGVGLPLEKHKWLYVFFRNYGTIYSREAIRHLLTLSELPDKMFWIRACAVRAAIID